MSRLNLFLFGPPRIELDGVPVEIDRRKAIALITYLSVTGESQGRDTLATLLWPEYDQTRARAALRRTLSALNKALGSGWVEVQRESLGLNHATDFWSDVDSFRNLLAQCRSHGHQEDEVCPDCLDPLTQAAELYRDDFTAGFSLQDSMDFDNWQFFQVESLRTEIGVVLERLVRYHSESGDLELAIGYARRWLEIDRTNEMAHRRLMELYAKTGRRPAALRQYEECVRLLEKELNEVPQEVTVRLYQAIKENRALENDTALLKSPDSFPNNLPGQLTSFIGREREIAEVVRLISASRLLTLTGSGGCGKTRLSLQVGANLLKEYSDGVWLVELETLSDPLLIPRALASALGVSEKPGYPLIDTLTDYLQSKQILIVMDNCEHLIEACVTLVASLLKSCPNLRILATSREVLGITGETAYRVPSLSLPDNGNLTTEMEDPSRDSGQALVASLIQYEAISLFIDRAVAVQPTFTVTDHNAPAVAQICHRLDGIPLAIELAAARVKALAVEQISNRLDDRFRLLTGGSRAALPRQQTLRATMDWSHDLLSEDERVLLSRLSVFAGGFTLDAAEAVAGEPEMDVLDLLTRLVDKSLVVVEEAPSPEGGGEARYHLLQTIRQYGRERLIESGTESELSKRHGGWFLGLAQRAEPELHGLHQVLWLDRLEREHDNLRAVLEWGRSEKGNPEIALRLAGALWWFWYVRGYFSEGLGWLEGALSMNDDVPNSVRAGGLYRAGALAWYQGYYERAVTLSEESLELFRELGDDKVGIAFALIILALVAVSQGDYGRALEFCKESLSLFRESGYKWGIPLVLFILGEMARYQEDYTRAMDLCEQSLPLFRELGDRWGIANSLRVLGIVVGYQGDYGRALELCGESLDLFREMGDRWGIANSLRILARVVCYQGDYDRASELYKESLIVLRDLRDRGSISECLEGLVRVGVAQGQLEQAARLSGASEALREVTGAPLMPSDRVDYDRSLDTAREKLGQEAFKAAWGEGRTMSMDEAIEYALTKD